MADLFSNISPDSKSLDSETAHKSVYSASSHQPLAARMRPKSLDDFAGQQHLFAKDKPLYKAISQGQPHSMLLWGPPGTGKTTLAHIIAESCDCHFISISAVLGSVKDIRHAVKEAQQLAQIGRKTLLFVDEVHRFNKSQQDAFLPYVEDGTFIFIGATTENPSFEVNNALLSRAKTYVLKALGKEDLEQLLHRAIRLENQAKKRHPQSDQMITDSQESKSDSQQANTHSQPYQITQEAAQLLVSFADGDARRLLNLLEMALQLADQKPDSQKSDSQKPDSQNLSAEGQVILLDRPLIEPLLSDNHRRFDNQGEAFYDQISALHKSVRGSNPDGALYWFCRMIDGGCDPLYIARRVVRMASEDIGNADPRGLQLAINAWDVQQRLGSPEGELAIAQAIIYLAVAAKSNAVYEAFNRCMAEVKKDPSYEVPLHLRNAPTQLLKSLDYGAKYRYDHHEEDGFAAGQTYLPEEKASASYYQPVDRGLEQKIAEKMAYLASKIKQ